MASLIKFVVLVCAVAAVCANPVDWDGLDTDAVLLEDLIEFAGKDQSTVLGNCQPCDKRLYAENLNIRAGQFQGRKKDVIYPRKNSDQGGLISCIKITDQLKTDKNGSFKISHGGVNQRFVTITFIGGKGQPIKYNVEIFGQ